MDPWAESLSFSLLRVIFWFFFSLLLIHILRYYMPMILSLFNSTRNPFGRAHTVGDGGIQSWHHSKKRCRLYRYEEKARSMENVYTLLRARNAFFSTEFPFLRIFPFSELTPSKKQEKGPMWKRIQDEIYRTYWLFFSLDVGNKHQEKMSTDYNEY